jgi:AcrR family transcriptional regulator
MPAKPDKREVLLQTALRLFVDSGFNDTPTSRIAKEANIATGTLFYFFPTKDHLIHALYAKLKSQSQEYVLRAIAEGASRPEIIKAYYVESLHWALDHQPEFSFLAQYVHSPYARQAGGESAAPHPILTHLEQAIAHQEIQALDTALVYALLNSHVLGVHQFMLSKALKGEQRQEIIQTTFELFWNMISP